MAKIRFENGTVVNFEGNPSPSDIEEIASTFQPSKITPKFNPLDFIRSALTPLNPMTEQGRQNLNIPGMAGYTAIREGLNPTIAKVGVPAIQQVPIVKDIPFGARLLGDPNAGLDLITAFTNPGKEVIKEGATHLPQIMGKNYLLGRAKEAASHLEDLKTGFGSIIDDTLNQSSKFGFPYKDVIVDATKLSGELNQLKLPDTVISRLKQPMYKIQFLPDGSVNPTIGNLQKVRHGLSDMMTDRAWLDAPNLVKENIKNAYGIIGNSMKETAPELKGAFDAFHSFMEDIYKPVSKRLIRAGQIVEKPLRGAVGKGAEGATKEALSEFGQLSPRVAQILKDFGKFNQRVVAKKVAGKVALGAALGGAGLGGILYGLHKRE